jgi:hypothetical protein
MADDGKLIQWSVVLDGDAADLAAWERQFHSGPDARVERFDHGGRSEHVLQSRHFDLSAPETQVRAVAERLIAQMHGAVKLVEDGCGPVTIKHTIAHTESGKRNVHILLKGAAITARVGSVTVLLDGVPMKPVEAENALSLGARDEKVADALKHFAHADDWGELYKTLEVLEDALRGRRVVWEKGWATRGDVTDLARTINYHRHANEELPPRLLTQPEAVAMMRGLLREWIREKDNSAG